MLAEVKQRAGKSKLLAHGLLLGSHVDQSDVRDMYSKLIKWYDNGGLCRDNKAKYEAGLELWSEIDQLIAKYNTKEDTTMKTEATAANTTNTNDTTNMEEQNMENQKSLREMIQELDGLSRRTNKDGSPSLSARMGVLIKRSYKEKQLEQDTNFRSLCTLYLEILRTQRQGGVVAKWQWGRLYGAVERFEEMPVSSFETKVLAGTAKVQAVTDGVMTVVNGILSGFVKSAGTTGAQLVETTITTGVGVVAHSQQTWYKSRIDAYDPNIEAMKDQVALIRESAKIRKEQRKAMVEQLRSEATKAIADDATDEPEAEPAPKAETPKTTPKAPAEDTEVERDSEGNVLFPAVD